MNKEQTKAAIAVMQAWVDGAEIEYRRTDASPKWYKLEDSEIYGVTWSWYNTTYRVAIAGTLPVIPWNAIVPEYKYAARDEDGDVYMYTQKPHLGIAAWGSASYKRLDRYFTVFDPGTCDWKQSLVERPS